MQGMTLVPSVTELILAELLYLQYEDNVKPVYLYINSTGTSKVPVACVFWFASLRRIRKFEADTISTFMLFSHACIFPSLFKKLSEGLRRRAKNMVMIQRHSPSMIQ